MSRKPTSTNAEIDAAFQEFHRCHGRMPGAKELRELLPGGVSNDRASAARARAKKAEDAVYPTSDPKPYEATAFESNFPERDELTESIIAVFLGGQTGIDRVVDEWAKARKSEMRAEIQKEVEASLNGLVQQVIKTFFA